MTTLIACLSTGKGTWGHVSKLIEDEKFEKVFLITNDFGKENFQKKENTELIAFNFNQGMMELRDEIYNSLKNKIKEEVAVNIISGAGKEHMAILGAILKLGVGMRFLAVTKDGVKEI